MSGNAGFLTNLLNCKAFTVTVTPNTDQPVDMTVDVPGLLVTDIVMVTGTVGLINVQSVYGFPSADGTLTLTIVPAQELDFPQVFNCVMFRPEEIPLENNVVC